MCPDLSLISLSKVGAYPPTKVAIKDGPFIDLVGALEHLFSHILGRITPTDFHSIIFQRGRSTTNQWFTMIYLLETVISTATYGKPESFFHHFAHDYRLFGQKNPHVSIIELDDGNIYRKPLYLMVKTLVSCRFSLKPIHCFDHVRSKLWFPMAARCQSSSDSQSGSWNMERLTSLGKNS